MPNRRSHCGTITAVTSIWVTMYRRNRLCRYRSTTNKGTESDCGESPSLHSRGAVLVTVSAVGDSDSAMEAQEDARGIEFCRAETSSDMLAERAWLGVFFEGLGVGERVLSGDISAGDISARFFCVSTRTVPSNSSARRRRRTAARRGDTAGSRRPRRRRDPTPRAQSTPTPSACAGSAAVAASASTASALERSPGRRAAPGVVAAPAAPLLLGHQRVYPRHAHADALGPRAALARSAFCPRGGAGGGRRGTTGESSSASVVSPGRARRVPRRARLRGTPPRATSRGSAACGARRARRRWRCGGRDAEKTYPLPISLYTSPRRCPPHRSPDGGAGVLQRRRDDVDAPRVHAEVLGHAAPGAAPRRTKSSRPESTARGACPGRATRARARRGRCRRSTPSDERHRRRPAARPRQVTPSSASRLAKTPAVPGAAVVVPAHVHLERRKPAKRRGRRRGPPPRRPTCAPARGYRGHRTRRRSTEPPPDAEELRDGLLTSCAAGTCRRTRAASTTSNRAFTVAAPPPSSPGRRSNPVVPLDRVTSYVWGCAVIPVTPLRRPCCFWSQAHRVVAQRRAARVQGRELGGVPPLESAAAAFLAAGLAASASALRFSRSTCSRFSTAAASRRRH